MRTFKDLRVYKMTKKERAALEKLLTKSAPVQSRSDAKPPEQMEIPKEMYREIKQ